MVKKTKTYRSYRPIELWSKKYYEEKVQPLVNAELDPQDISNRSVRLKVIKNKTREVFAEESSDVREKIMQEVEIMKGKAKQMADNSEDPCSLPPEEVQAYVIKFH